MEHEKLGSIVEELESEINEDELFHLLMVALDEKPGGLVMDPDRDLSNVLERSLQELDLSYRKLGDERSLLDKLLRRKSIFDTKGLFYTRDDSRFDILEDSEGQFYGCSNRAVGEFLGYPLESVEYYSGSERPGMDTIREIKTKFGDKELKYLALVGFIPAPTEGQVDDAIRRGRERAEKVDQMAEEGFQIGKKLKKKVMDESLWKQANPVPRTSMQ